MVKVENYDFRKPQRYSSENIRCMNFIADDFCKKSTIYMNYELKFKTKLEVKEIVQTNYQEFLDSVGPATIIVQNSIRPMVKNLILKMDKSIATIWIDVISGGTGIVKNKAREFTEIDMKVLRHMIDNILKKIYIPSSCECALVDNIYTSANMPQFCAPSESVCIIDMEVEVGNQIVGNIAFCAPYNSIEPILGELSAMNLPVDFNLSNNEELENKIHENTIESYMKITAEMCRIDINVEDLLKLEVGDVIVSNKKISESIDVYVEDKNIYNSMPGLVGKKKGIKIIDIV